jgi:hypothetical protein
VVDRVQTRPKSTLSRVLACKQTDDVPVSASYAQAAEAGWQVSRYTEGKPGR